MYASMMSIAEHETVEKSLYQHQPDRLGSRRYRRHLFPWSNVKVSALVVAAVRAARTRLLRKQSCESANRETHMSRKRTGLPKR